MVDKVKCCCPKKDECADLVHEGIQAQCVGLEDLKRHDIVAAREHILWGLQKVIEGLRCAERG